jgi:pimeloyl-ACP methyl ester carboxylesterase
VVSTLIGLSGDAPEINLLKDVDPRAPFGTFAESALPAWLTKEDLDHYTSEYERTGYRGGLNWYRNSRSNWELMAAWDGVPLHQPSLFAAGDRDPVISWFGLESVSFAALRNGSMPNLTKAVMLEGCGHWTQQERPAEVNQELVQFLAGLPGR